MESEDDSIFGQEHSFVHELHHSATEEYLQNYNDDHSKYFRALEAIPESKEIPAKEPAEDNSKKGKIRRVKRDK
jgi:hypothetical protein